jgi:hypothetical protein
LLPVLPADQVVQRWQRWGVVFDQTYNRLMAQSSEIGAKGS